MKKLEEEIYELRMALYEVAYEAEAFSSDEVIELSQKLDEKLVKLQIEINNEA